MIFSYEEIKEHVKNRNDVFRFAFNKLLTIFEELYNPEEIKFVYIKNLFNNEEVETFFFYEDKIISITKQESHYEFIEHRSKILKKRFFVSEESTNEIELSILLDNGEEITFNNHKDSIETWAWDYGQDLKELYKLL